MSTAPGPVTPAAPPAKGGISAKAVIAIILLVLALIFIFSNLSDGTLRFLGFQFTMPIWIWFLIVLIVGVIVGSMFPWFRPKKKKK